MTTTVVSKFAMFDSGLVFFPEKVSFTKAVLVDCEGHLEYPRFAGYVRFPRGKRSLRHLSLYGRSEELRVSSEGAVRDWRQIFEKVTIREYQKREYADGSIIYAIPFREVKDFGLVGIWVHLDPTPVTLDELRRALPGV